MKFEIIFAEPPKLSEWKTCIILGYQFR
jgi:hypothetical protein